MYKLIVGSEEVELNPAHCEFRDDNLNEYLSKFAAWYSYYNQKHADAQYIAQTYEDKLNELTMERFRDAKERKASDKHADAIAETDPEVVEMTKKVRASKYVSARLLGFLRSMDKAHTNCLNYCYNIRKEMDKLHGSVKNLDDILN